MIGSRSWPDRGFFLKQNRGLVKANPEATSSPSKTAPTTLQIRPHDCFNCPRNLANFLFKNPCSSSLFFNFDRFVKELSEF